jgi:nitroreductase
MLAMITRRNAGIGFITTASLAAAGAWPAAATAQAIELPKPVTGGSRTLAEALRGRRSTREFASRPLSLTVLSGLLWSAYGINRPQSGDRTAPSWRHAIEQQIYLALPDGVWLYDPASHSLLPHLGDDLRGLTGTQDFVGTAPLNLVYVADGARMGNASGEEKRLYAFTDTGFIGQNVYLFCASEGLATVFRGSVEREKLGKALQLRREQFVTFAQTVGYPKA